MINSYFRKKMADSWFEYLQSQICKEFEYLENNKLISTNGRDKIIKFRQFY